MSGADAAAFFAAALSSAICLSEGPQPASSSRATASEAAKRYVAAGMFLVMAVPPNGEWTSSGLPAVGERFGDRRGHETGYVAAQARDFAHERRRDEAVLLGWRQEQRLGLGDEMPVHARQLELVF